MDRIISMESLASLYRATTYRVGAPGGPIDIRIGEKHPRIDALLLALKATDWAFITAWNPGSRLTSSEQNLAAQEELLRAIRDAGFAFYEGAGVPDRPGWAPERSVWIAGIRRKKSVELGREFGQNAIVAGELGGVAELIDLAPH